MLCNSQNVAHFSHPRPPHVGFLSHPSPPVPPTWEDQCASTSFELPETSGQSVWAAGPHAEVCWVAPKPLEGQVGSMLAAAQSWVCTVCL